MLSSDQFEVYDKQINTPFYKLSKLLKQKKPDLIVKFENEISENNNKLLNNIIRDFPLLDKNLLKLRPGSMRYAVNVEYGKQYKIYSKEYLIKNYRIHENINSIINFDNVCVGDKDIINMWEKCIETNLFPKIIENQNDYVLVEYLDKDFKTLYDLYFEKGIYYISSIIKKNRDKLYSYYNKIKHQSLCINDFNFKNFVVDIKTQELFMIDMGDIDYTRFFTPEMFILDYNDKLNMFVFKSIGKREKNFYINLIFSYYKKDEINKIFFM